MAYQFDTNAGAGDLNLLNDERVVEVCAFRYSDCWKLFDIRRGGSCYTITSSKPRDEATLYAVANAMLRIAEQGVPK